MVASKPVIESTDPACTYTYSYIQCIYTYDPFETFASARDDWMLIAKDEAEWSFLEDAYVDSDTH